MLERKGGEAITSRKALLDHRYRHVITWCSSVRVRANVCMHGRSCVRTRANVCAYARARGFKSKLYYIYIYIILHEAGSQPAGLGGARRAETHLLVRWLDVQLEHVGFAHHHRVLHGKAARPLRAVDSACASGRPRRPRVRSRSPIRGYTRKGRMR